MFEQRSLNILTDSSILLSRNLAAVVIYGILSFNFSTCSRFTPDSLLQIRLLSYIDSLVLNLDNNNVPKPLPAGQNTFSVDKIFSEI